MGMALGMDPPSGVLRIALKVTFALIISAYSLRGLSSVGSGSVVICAVVLSPFAVLSLLAPFSIPSFDYLLSARPAAEVHWAVWIHTLLWSFNSFDSIASFAGQIADPVRTIPRALRHTLALVTLSYMIPLLAAVGLSPDLDLWLAGGHWTTVAHEFGGKPFSLFMLFSATVGTASLFGSAVASDSFKVLGMARMGLVPSALGAGSGGSPVVGVFLSFAVAALLSPFDFHALLQVGNVLYGVGLIAVLATAVHLRWSSPALPRPFRAPLGAAAFSALCALPMALALSTILLSSAGAWAAAAALAFGGLALFDLLETAKRKRYFRFDTMVSKLEIDV